VEECSSALLADLREREERPERAVSLRVSLDGGMMRMNAGTEDGKPTDAAKAGYAIGSGSVEAANKVLVTVRMKRSGQSRGRAGAAPEPSRRLEAPGMRQRKPASDPDRPRRVIRGQNISGSKSEPYENRTRCVQASVTVMFFF